MAAAASSSQAATWFSRVVKSSTITTDIFAPSVVTSTSGGRDPFAARRSRGGAAPMTSLLVSGPLVESALFARRVKIVFIYSSSIRPPVLLREHATTEQFAIQRFQQRDRRNHPIPPRFPRADHDVKDSPPLQPEPVEHRAE